MSDRDKNFNDLDGRWLKHVYNTLGYEFKKNLKAFYVVHPTMWTRVTCWWYVDLSRFQLFQPNFSQGILKGEVSLYH
jgi:hypothetical protein